jgi:hypothetical protein
MRKVIFFFFFIFIQSFAAFTFSQALDYLGSKRYPILDTSKYDYEYLRITSEQDVVIHKQLINRDAVKVVRTAVMLDENRGGKVQSTLG